MARATDGIPLSLQILVVSPGRGSTRATSQPHHLRRRSPRLVVPLARLDYDVAELFGLCNSGQRRQRQLKLLPFRHRLRLICPAATCIFWF